MTDAIKTLINKRRKEYMRRGRSEKHQRLAKAIRKSIRCRKKQYSSAKIQNLLHLNPSRYHSAIEDLKANSRLDRWDVRDLFPDKTDAEIADVMAEHFSTVSEEFDPISTAPDSLPICANYSRRSQDHRPKLQNSYLRPPWGSPPLHHKEEFVDSCGVLD